MSGMSGINKRVPAVPVCSALFPGLPWGARPSSPDSLSLASCLELVAEGREEGSFPALEGMCLASLACMARGV